MTFKNILYITALIFYSLSAFGVSCPDMLSSVETSAVGKFNASLSYVFAESKPHMDHDFKANQFMTFYLLLGLDMEAASLAYTERAKMHPDRVVDDFYQLKNLLPDTSDKIIAMLVAEIDPGVNMPYVSEYFLKIKSIFGVNDEAAVILFSSDPLRSSVTTLTWPTREFYKLKSLLIDLNPSDQTLARLFKHPKALEHAEVVTKSFREFREHFLFLTNEMQARIFLSPKNNGFYGQLRTRFDNLQEALQESSSNTALIMAGSTNTGYPDQIALRYKGFNEAVVHIMKKLAQKK